jgi:hypothetical protein
MAIGLTVNYTDRARTKQNSRLIADSLGKIWSQAMENLRLIWAFTQEILLLEFLKEKVFLFRAMNAMRGGLKGERKMAMAGRLAQDKRKKVGNGKMVCSTVRDL